MPTTRLEKWREGLSRASQASYAAVAVDGQPIGALSSSNEDHHAEEGLRPRRRLDAGDRRGSCRSGSVGHLATDADDQSHAMHEVCPVADGGDRGGSQRAGHGCRHRHVRHGRHRDLPPAGADECGESRDAEGGRGANRARTTGRPFAEVYAEQLEEWKEDMRSESTEWQDPDSDERYSGLAISAVPAGA